MKKLKLKPSARDKRRYFIVSISQKETKEILTKYLGILGLAKAAYMPVKVESIPKGKTVGSCLAKSLNDVRSSMSLAGFPIEKVSGTIKGLTK